MSNQPDERRKFTRLSVLADVSYTKKDLPQEENATFTKNIGKGGICLITYEQLNESDVLELTISLPNEKEPVNVTGKVCWVKPFNIGTDPSGARFDVGIEFIKISDGDKQKIDGYVFSHNPVKE